MKSSQRRGLCFRCGQPGHFARDCREAAPSSVSVLPCPSDRHTEAHCGIASPSDGQALPRASLASAGNISCSVFRRNVVAILFNSDQQVLACFRKDRKGLQFVQGGVEDDDTDVITAAWREIDEEIGLRQEEHGIEFVGAVPPPSGDPCNLRYLFPKYAAPQLRSRGYIGQQQELLLFYAPTAAIDSVRLIPTAEQVAASGAKQEFRRVEWMDMPSFLARCTDVKRHIFEYVAVVVSPLMQAYLSLRATSTNATPAAVVASGAASGDDADRKRARQQSVECEKNSGAEVADRRMSAVTACRLDP